MEFKQPENLTTQEYIEFLRRAVLVHSYIYYELNNNVLSDKEYDGLSIQLVKLQKDNPKIKGMYYKQFKDFDGTTGFDLYGKLNNKEKGVIQAIAISVLNSYRKDKISQRS